MYSDLPLWLQRVAEVFPLKWMAQSMRSVFFPDAFKAIEPRDSWEHPMTAVVLAVWLVFGLVVGIRTFRWTRRGDN
jgi:ABC-2 type transport system permease protein